MKLSPQFFGMPGKNSASLESVGIAVFAAPTRQSPIWLVDISATVSGFSTCLPSRPALVQDHADELQVVAGTVE